MPDPRLLVLADDLSGAAETAAALGAPVPVLLAPHDDVDRTGTGDVVIDLDCRYAPPDTARRRTESALARGAAGADARVLVKIDSFLRGNVTAQLAGVLTAARGPVVLAPALPEHGRTVVDGVPLVDDVPLADTTAWRVEDRPAPRHLRDLCPGRAAHAGLASVRGDGLADVLHENRLVTCDAVTAEDLLRVVGAVGRAGGTLVGSSALARAAAAARPAPARRARAGEHGGTRTAPCLTVLGTAAPAVATQVDRLDAAFPQTVVEVPATEVASWADDPAARSAVARRVARALAAGDVTVRMTDDGTAVDPRPLPGLLGELVAGALATAAGPVDLVVSGGETARSALSRLGARRLDVLAEIHPGAVLSRRDPAHDSFVVTRPGGQGGPDSLVLVREALHARRAGTRPATDTLEKNR